ncbi:MAG: pyridoxal-phosphate dependent enzyme [Pseudomonadales bacterium]|nr:pyridoxal-phosphate dependent enzyme [Pseudomonadales bacterium]NRA14454.1 pyridoxal-phosphate dependent enzyme [Oceanospirillaceae bacterium]
MDFHSSLTLTSQLLDCALYRDKNLSVYLIRSEKIHREVSGNKWFKLKYSLLKAQRQNCQQVISFGGAYSNHIHALAFAAKSLGLPVIGYIRGQWSEDNQTLQDASRWGMQLKSLSRQQYREKSTAEFLQQLEAEYPNSFIIPEGGSNIDALTGVGELMGLIESSLPKIDTLVAACGTGGTLAGLIATANSTRSILGIPVLKGAGFLETDINALLKRAGASAGCGWRLDLNGHYGGYGKAKAEHLAQMLLLEKRHQIRLDPVYTAKMWRRFDELVHDDYFIPGSAIALLHSGGLQGRRGFNLD